MVIQRFLTGGLNDFWDWFRAQYGDELADAWIKRASVFPFVGKVPDEIKPYFEHWQTSVTPKLTEDEIKDYEALAQTHLERQVQEGKMTYEQYKEELGKVQAEVDAGLVSRKSPYYQEATNLAPDWAYKIQQQQLKQQEAEQEKQKRFEQTELAKQEAQFETEKGKAEALAGRQETEARPELLTEQKATMPAYKVPQQLKPAAQISELTPWLRKAQQYGIDVSDELSTEYGAPGTDENVGSTILALQRKINAKEQEWEQLKKEAKIVPRSMNRPQRLAKI